MVRPNFYEMDEAEVFGTLPGGGKRASMQRTPRPPPLSEVGEEKRGSVSETLTLAEFADFAALTESDVSDRESKGAIKKKLQVRLHRMKVSRAPTPVPRQGKSLALSPGGKGEELMPPPLREVWIRSWPVLKHLRRVQCRRTPQTPSPYYRTEMLQTWSPLSMGFAR